MFLNRADAVEIGDYAYPIINDFRVYLTVHKILKSEDILEEDKVATICDLVFIDKIKPKLMLKAIEGYFKLFVKGNSKGEAVFDLEQDKELIYSAFLQVYKIDLDTAEMSVEKFLALLQSIPEGTKFAEVIKIRTMPIPAPTKYNANERNAIIKAKASVALKGTDNLGKGLKNFAELMRVWSNYGR